MLYWIWLAQARQIGAVTAARLLEYFGSPEAIYRLDAAALKRAGLSQREILSLGDKSLAEAEDIAERCEAAGIRIVTLSDDEYPESLRAIQDPPVVLYYRGRLPALEDRPTIGVVGARKASAYALAEARRIGYQIGHAGGIVVTGLARGIDTQAAEGALMADLPVIGVLGCGVDIVYPPENRILFQNVLQRGCIVSEYPPGVKPLSTNFPPRNRIISGLSDGVIIVEAAEKSGALITAQHALDQGRDVFVVPGNVNNPACAGSNRLLRQAGMAVTSGYDAVMEYEYRYPDTICVTPADPRELPAAEPAAAPAPQRTEERPKPVLQQNRRPIEIQKLAGKVSADEYALLEFLAGGVRQVDDIIHSSKLSPSRALSAITMLEIKGYVIRLPGKYFRLAEE